MALSRVRRELNKLCKRGNNLVRRGLSPQEAAKKICSTEFPSITDELVNKILYRGLATMIDDYKRSQEGINLREEAAKLTEGVVLNMDKIELAHQHLIRFKICNGCTNTIRCVFNKLGTDVSYMSESEIETLVQRTLEQIKMRRNSQERKEEAIHRDRIFTRRKEIDQILHNMFQESWEVANGSFKNPLDFSIEDHIYQKECALKNMEGFSKRVQWHERTIELLRLENKRCIEDLSITSKNKVRVFSIAILGSDNRGVISPNKKASTEA